MSAITDPHQRVAELVEAFEKAARNWYSAGVVALLALPPAATQALEAYADALATFLAEVDSWANEYVAGVASTDDENEARSDLCQQLHQAAQDKRDNLVGVAKKQFDEGAWARA